MGKGNRERGVAMVIIEIKKEMAVTKRKIIIADCVVIISN